MWGLDNIAFTKGQISLLTSLDTCTYRRFYTQRVLHAQKLLHTEALHTETFTHTDSFHTQMFLQTNAFTHKRFYTQTLYTDLVTHKPFCT